MGTWLKLFNKSHFWDFCWNQWEPESLSTGINCWDRILSSLGGVFLRVKRHIEESGLERERDKLLASLLEHLDPAIPAVNGHLPHSGLIRNMSQKKKNHLLCIRQYQLVFLPLNTQRVSMHVLGVLSNSFSSLAKVLGAHCPLKLWGSIPFFERVNSWFNNCPNRNGCP